MITEHFLPYFCLKCENSYYDDFKIFDALKNQKIQKNPENSHAWLMLTHDGWDL